MLSSNVTSVSFMCLSSTHRGNSYKGYDIKTMNKIQSVVGIMCFLRPQIEEFAMIPAKEAKDMLYRMFGEQFVTITVSETS